MLRVLDAHTYNVETFFDVRIVLLVVREQQLRGHRTDNKTCTMDVDRTDTFMKPASKCFDLLIVRKLAREVFDM